MSSVDLSEPERGSGVFMIPTKANVIVDLDGTVADCEWRETFIKAPPGREEFKPDWQAFHRESKHDMPHDDVLELVVLLAERYAIWICTGRDDGHRAATEQWLREHGLNVPSERLLMRPQGNYDSDVRIKLRLAEDAGLRPDNTLLVLDDRDKVVEAWRKAGFRCLQVRPGTF
jgi:FMN phosphatase YigB (HAD superfamily)